MTKRVIDLGNCAYDHGNIRALIEKNFEAQVVQTHSEEQTRAELDASPTDLLLINRKLDEDGSDGIAILKKLKANPQYAAVPIILVTNLPEFQAQAIQAGAAPGFGKRELNHPETIAKLGSFLR